MKPAKLVPTPKLTPEERENLFSAKDVFGPILIDRVDRMGQGVAFHEFPAPIGGKTLFIPKVLPGEQVTFNLISVKKGVAFGRLKEIVKTSEVRVAPDCPHFSECSGCDYLHLNYENEIAFKRQAVMDLFLRRDEMNFPFQPDMMVPSAERYGLRNRLQLHYDIDLKKQKFSLGFKRQDGEGGWDINSVPSCLLPDPVIHQQMQKLYGPAQKTEALNDQEGGGWPHWVELWSRDKNARRDQGQRFQGHLELYRDPNGEKVSMAWDQPYAHLGFSQVNRTMNLNLQLLVREWVQKLAPQKVLELFCGDGNLTNFLRQSPDLKQYLGIDSNLKNASTSGPGGNRSFKQMNLYQANAINMTLDHIRLMGFTKQADLLLLDPPRSGLQNLGEWVQVVRPRWILYVSCDPMTLKRDLLKAQTDLKGMAEFSFSELKVLDMFPGTHHFETVTLIELKF